MAATGRRRRCDATGQGGRDSDDSREPAYSILSASIISMYIFKEVERAVAVECSTVEVGV